MNDITLLKLENPVQYNNLISQICLPSQDINIATIGKSSYILGWGQINSIIGTNALRQATVTIQSISACGKSSNSQICSGWATPHTGACYGDSG